MTKRTQKTREQRATDDLEIGARVAKRAAAKRDRLKAEYDQALADSLEADSQLEFLKTNPFLPTTQAPVRRTRAPRPVATTGPLDPAETVA